MKNRFEIRGDVTAILIKSPKHGELEVLIDTIDLPRVQEFPHKWYAHWNKSTKSFYCRGNSRLSNGKRITILIHRLITNCSKGMHVDHRNHQTLDNRRWNLRKTTPSENMQNRKGAREDNKSSGIRGVTWYPRDKKWRVRVQTNGKSKIVGYFDDIRDAENAAIGARSRLMPFSQEAG